MYDGNRRETDFGSSYREPTYKQASINVHDFVIHSKLSQLPRETVVSTSLIVYRCFLIN